MCSLKRPWKSERESSTSGTASPSSSCWAIILLKFFVFTSPRLSGLSDWNVRSIRDVLFSSSLTSDSSSHDTMSANIFASNLVLNLVYALSRWSEFAILLVRAVSPRTQGFSSSCCAVSHFLGFHWRSFAITSSASLETWAVRADFFRGGRFPDKILCSISWSVQLPYRSKGWTPIL